jgi:hypothetical protein
LEQKVLVDGVTLLGTTVPDGYPVRRLPRRLAIGHEKDKATLLPFLPERQGLRTSPFAAMEMDNHTGLWEQVSGDVDKVAASEPAGAEVFIRGRHLCSFAAVKVMTSIQQSSGVRRMSQNVRQITSMLRV